MQRYTQGPSKYDQFFQQIVSFNTQLDKVPTKTEKELTQARDVFLYYQKTFGEYHKELSEQLKRAAGNPLESQRLVLVLGKLAEAEKILLDVQSKIATITQRFFPSAQQPVSKAPSPRHAPPPAQTTTTPQQPVPKTPSPTQSPPPEQAQPEEVKESPGEKLFAQLDDFAERVESFKTRVFQELQSAKTPMSTSNRQRNSQRVNELRSEASRLHASMGAINQDAGMLEIEEEMLVNVNNTLDRLEKELGRNDEGGSSSSRQSTQLSGRAQFALGARVDFGVATAPLISNPWMYDEKGEARTHESHKNYIREACEGKEIKNSPRFYQLTQEVCDLLGDGCCGYYCISAALLQRAIDDPEFKKALRDRIEFLASQWPEKPEAISFEDGGKKKMINKKELAGHVLALLDSIDSSADLKKVLTKENGQILNLFFRAALREGVASKQLDPDFVEALELPDEEGMPLIQGLEKQYKDIDEPMVYALNNLLQVNIGVIDFDGKTLRLPDDPANEGYLIRTTQAGGHYLVAFARPQE